jgi:hypothetical protein
MYWGIYKGDRERERERERDADVLMGSSWVSVQVRFRLP